MTDAIERKTIREVIEHAASECDFDSVQIDEEINAKMPYFDAKEMTVKEVLDLCCKLAGANYTVCEKVLHVFTPSSRPHPILASTSSKEQAVKNGLTDSKGKANEIKKGTIVVTEDATQLKNRIQMANGGTPGERTEEYVGDGVRDEFHQSYETSPVMDISVQIGEFSINPEFVRQDWGDRQIVEDARNASLCYVSPEYDGATASGTGFGAYVNRKEKHFRLVNTSDGQPYYPPEDSIVKIVYKHYDPTFHIIQDDASIEQWGLREDITVSPQNTRQYDALLKRLAEAEVRDRCQPLKNIQCEVFEDVYQVGDSIRFVIPELDIDESLCIYEVVRSFDTSVKKNFGNNDYGQSVRLRVGSKIPIEMKHIMKAVFNRIKLLERNSNQADLDSESGFSVPKEWDRLFSEKIKITEGFAYRIYETPNRINKARINRSRIQNSSGGWM